MIALVKFVMLFSAILRLLVDVFVFILLSLISSSFVCAACFYAFKLAPVYPVEVLSSSPIMKVYKLIRQMDYYNFMRALAN